VQVPLVLTNSPDITIDVVVLSFLQAIIVSTTERINVAIKRAFFIVANYLVLNCDLVYNGNTLIIAL